MRNDKIAEEEKPQGIVIALTPKMVAKCASVTLGISIQVFKAIKSVVDRAVPSDTTRPHDDEPEDTPRAVIIDEPETVKGQEEEEIHVEARENECETVDWKEVETQIEEGFNSVNWKEVGEQVKEGLDSVDWKEVGQSIKEGLDSVDWKEVGQQISDAFKEQPEDPKADDLMKK